MRATRRDSGGRRSRGASSPRTTATANIWWRTADASFPREDRVTRFGGVRRRILPLDDHHAVKFGVRIAGGIPLPEDGHATRPDGRKTGGAFFPRTTATHKYWGEYRRRHPPPRRWQRAKARRRGPEAHPHPGQSPLRQCWGEESPAASPSETKATRRGLAGGGPQGRPPPGRPPHRQCLGEDRISGGIPLPQDSQVTRLGGRSTRGTSSPRSTAMP